MEREIRFVGVEIVFVVFIVKVSIMFGIKKKGLDC